MENQTLLPTGRLPESWVAHVHKCAYPWLLHVCTHTTQLLEFPQPKIPFVTELLSAPRVLTDSVY